jgi:PAS domain S-box-containing protein
VQRICIDLARRANCHKWWGKLKPGTGQLHAVNDDLSNFASSTGIATLFLDKEFRIVRYTPATKQFFNLIDSDVGRHIGDIKPKFNDENLASEITHVEKTQQPTERVVATQDCKKYLRRIIPYMTSDNQINGVVVTFFDVTQRIIDEQKVQESEVRFRDYANAGANRFWETGKDNRFTWVSAGPAPYPGDKHQDVVGKTRWQMAGADADLDSIWKDHKIALLAHKPFRDFEYSVGASKGAIRWWRESGVPIFDNTGDFQGYRGTTSDITDSKLLEEKLRRAQRMKSIGHLTGGIAHDFNNILAILLGNVELVELTEVLSDENREALTAIKTAVDRGASLTNRLLGFGRVQALMSVPTDLVSRISGMEKLIERALGESVTLEVIQQDRKAIVDVDPNQFENALLNLVINAGAAMPNGGKLTIETSYVRIDKEYIDANPEAVIGNFVCTEITDNGIGMSPKVLNDAWEPFFTTKAVGEGSGLGLSTVQGFCAQSGGYLTVDSALGQGTKIKLYLPVSLATPSNYKGVAFPLLKFDKQYRVLLIEDDEPVRKLATKLLQSMGLQVVAAEDGKAALKFFDEGEKFDLLLSDVLLPGGMSGWDVVTEIRGHQPDIGVIICTGYVFEDSAESNLANIVVLKKPYKRVELGNALHDLLDHFVDASNQ